MDAFLDYEGIPCSIYIYNLDGSPITEIEAITSQSWRLNGVGEINLTLSIFDEKCRRELVEFGRFILVRHPRMPDWAGPIDTPRDWGGFQVLVHGYTAERMLYRRSGMGQRLTGSAGAIFEKILEIANRKDDTLIRPGVIWKGGNQRERTLDYKDLLREVQGLSSLAKNDFGIEPEVGRDERLIFRAHWWERRGTRNPLAYTEGGEGANIEVGAKPLREQGEIWNNILGYGEGATWASRPKYEAINEESKRRFGLYQTARYYQGVSDPATLKENVEKDLQRLAFPRNVFSLGLLDIGDTWEQSRMGDIHQVVTSYEGFSDSGGFGFEGEARIKSMAFGGTKGSVSVVMQQFDEED